MTQLNVRQFFHHVNANLKIRIEGKGKSVPLQAWTGRDVSRKLRLQDFKTIGT